MDLLRLAWYEIRLDRQNMCLVFLLETLLFTNIIILLLFSFGLDSVFDSYCRENIPDIYDVTLYHVDESELAELEQDGFSDMELCYDESRNYFFTYAQMESLVQMDYKKAKWRLRGITIKSSLEEIVGVMIFIKAAFLFLSALGILLCILATGNFYQMKIQKRTAFTDMLFRLGMPPDKIGGIYRIPFLLLCLLSVAAAYGLSFPVMAYFNRMIRQEFEGVSVDTGLRGILSLAIYVTAALILFMTLENRWKKISQN